MSDTNFLLAMMGPVGAFVTCMLVLLITRWLDHREAARDATSPRHGPSPRHTPAE